MKASGDTPMYAQIRNALRNDILNSVLATGQKIPSEDELASRFGVSRMTVRQGILDLVDEGLLYRRYGVGTFVGKPHFVRDHSRLSNSLEVARAEGIEMEVRILKTSIAKASLQVAQALLLDEGDLVMQVKSLRSIHALPITIHDSYIPYGLFPQLLLEDLEARHLWDIFESYGHRVKRAVQRLEAREACQDIAAFLAVDEGFPILYKERTVYLDDGTPIEFSYCFNRGDRYSLTISLDR